MGFNDCGCYVKAGSGKGGQVEIVYCPKHNAAPMLYEKLQKVCGWLIRLADDAEELAKTTRFNTIKEASEKDAKNLRVTRADIDKALSDAKRA